MLTFSFLTFLVFALVKKSTTREVCYDEVGCFSQDEPWVTAMRPFPQPASPDKIQVGFYLITRITPRNYPVTEELRVLLNSSWTSSNSLIKLDYKSFRQSTVFIIHGFAASARSLWMREMADAYLSKKDANIFLVDWGKGATGANYLQVAANTRVVGMVLANFIKSLIYSMGLYPGYIHIIGHSLGGHIAGYVGKMVPNIYRITVLDLAQPGFEGSDPKVRLHTTDAQNIDSVHTNGKPTIPFLGLGYITPIGHVDFYVNGGAHQPSCLIEMQIPIEIQTPLDLMKLPVEIIYTFLSCSHSMSIYYFMEAIQRDNCTMWGIRNNIVMGALNVATLGRIEKILLSNKRFICAIETCTPMGLDTFEYLARGKFQLITHAKSLYCIPDESIGSGMLRELKNFYKPFG